MDKEWSALLDSETSSREMRPVGAGWLTNKDLADNMGISTHAMKRKVIALNMAGRLEMFRGTQVTNNRLTVQVWYRIKKGTK